MKTSVDPDLCISCGLCVNSVPDVYDWDDDEKATATVDEVPSELEDDVKDAADNCPTDAIAVEE